MTKSNLKTKKNDGDVNDFIQSIQDETRRRDAIIVCKIMQETSGEKPVMWGSSIVGFGTYDYKYASGREGSWMRIGFSPRKQALTLYILYGLTDKLKPLLDKLGEYKTGKACLYIKDLDDIDLNVLRELIKHSYQEKAMGEK